MAMTMHVDVVSAEESLFSGMAEFVVVPAEQGDIGIYPRHAPLMAALRPGSVRIQQPGKDEEILIYVSGGLLEIQPHTVSVLSDTALRSHDLDEAQALAAKKQAEDLMSDRKAAMDYARAQVELAQAIAQLQAIQRLRKRGRG
jgi:F-type H+-transporting ATPase subunit epsilon